MLFKNGVLLNQAKFDAEKEIQTFIENHIPDILGEEYEFVSTEFSSGDFRVDTLAFNKETKSFIIIEDKKVENKSVIDQGLTYLKLLRDRKADFVLEYNSKKNKNYKLNDIDISQSKVLFFAPKYTEYQLYSSDYKNIPFDLYKVTKYAEGLFDISKIEKKSKLKMDSGIFNELVSSSENTEEIKAYTEEDHINNVSDSVKEIYEKLREEILELGDIDIEAKKVYIAFKGRRNIVDVELYQRKLTLFINMKKGSLKDPLNITTDISNTGHHGNGDYCVDLFKLDDIDNVIPLIKQSLEKNKK